MAQVPYEFLARWDYQTGQLKGAHVKVFDSVTQREGDAQPVAVAGASGFPLADILTAIQTGAIASMDAANIALAAEQAAHAVTTAELNTALAKLKAAGIP